MALELKPDYSVGVWASGGNTLTPTSDKINTGHVVERPPYEIVNYIENRQDKGIVYIFQNGIPKWDNKTTYPATGLSDHNGVTYRAVTQSVGREPQLNTANWKVAYASYDDVNELSNTVDKIISEDNFISHVVYKSDPILTGRAKGNGYLAASNLPTNTTSNVGYAFTQKPMSGMYLNKDKVTILDNGTTVATFSPTPVANTDVVTVAHLNQHLEIYGVGDIYITTKSSNPNTTKPYGKWIPFGEGKVLVGVSHDISNSSVPNWTKLGGQTFGEYDVSLTGEQNGPHTHIVTLWDAVTSGEGNTVSAGGGRGGSPWFTNTEDIKQSGSGAPHNNVQPSVTVYMWLRTE